MSNLPSIETVKRIKARHEAEILSKKHVVGLGVGYREQGGVTTNELSLVVFVSKKVPCTALTPEDCIPSSIEGVPTDVQEVGTVKAL
jgi:hypothetical protein